MSTEEEVLVFQMGLYEAYIPTALIYSDIHFWFDIRSENTLCGLSAYATRLLGDVFRLDWQVKVGMLLPDAEPLGEIESTKATSELYAPMPGRIVRINEEAVEKPALVAEDNYGTWLLEFEGRPAAAMNAEQYYHFLADGWEETEKFLKGQM